MQSKFMAFEELHAPLTLSSIVVMASSWQSLWAGKSGDEIDNRWTKLRGKWMSEALPFSTFTGVVEWNPVIQTWHYLPPVSTSFCSQPLVRFQRVSGRTMRVANSQDAPSTKFLRWVVSGDIGDGTVRSLRTMYIKRRRGRCIRSNILSTVR